MVDTFLRAGAVPHSVDAYFSVTAGPKGMGGHYATYQSLVEVRGGLSVLSRLVFARERALCSAPPPPP